MRKQDSNRYNSTAYKDKETLRELYIDEGLSISEVAETLDVAVSTIHRWLGNHNIPTRSRAHDREPWVTFDIDSGGYERWKDRDCGNHTTVRVHQLLAIAIGESPEDVFGGKEVHHINGIPWDNRPENIALLSPSEHRGEHSVGSDNPYSKLTEADIQDIRNRSEDGESGKRISEDYPVVEPTVERVIRGASWAHVE